MNSLLSNERALEILNNFQNSEVLVIGDIILDHFIWGKVTRMSPEAPVPVVEVQRDELLLGGCGNVVNNIHSLGGQVHCVAVTGMDEARDNLLNLFYEKKINFKRGIITDQERKTTIKTRIIAHNQQVVRIDREDKKPIRQDTIDSIISHIKSIIDDIKVIVISDYDKGVITPTFIDEIYELVKEKNITVCVDPKKSNFMVYAGCDIITPNHFEAGRALSREVETDHEVVMAGIELLKNYNFKSVLITRGERGMTLFEQGDPVTRTHFSTLAKEVYDVTGAGDTVIGVVALSLAAGATYKEASMLANYAASLVVGKIGTATITKEELQLPFNKE